MNVGQLIAEGGFPVARQSAGFIVTLLIATGELNRSDLIAQHFDMYLAQDYIQ